MDSLLNSQFLFCLRRYITDDIQPDISEMNIHYEEFIETLFRTVKENKEKDSRIRLLRILKLCFSELTMLKEYMYDGSLSGGDYMLMMASKALYHVNCELDLTVMFIENPHFIPHKSENGRLYSPYYWADECTTTDLVEFITAVHERGCVVMKDGTKPPFQRMIRSAEIWLNVDLKDARAIKAAALNRKIKLTSFIDTLRDALEECSMR